MRLEQLRYFVAVAEELHFRRAAERLNVSQPPLSFQIKALETELGAQLLKRTTRQVSLTEAGAALLEKARLILNLVEEAQEDVEAYGEGRAGTFSIGYTTVASFHPVFYETVFEFKRDNPAVNTRLSELVSERQMDALLNKTLDAGFLRSAPDGSGELDFMPVVEESLVLALHPSHPEAGKKAISLKDMRREPFITYPANAGVGIYRKVISLCERAGFEPRVAQEVSEPVLAVGLVASGMGVAIMPETLCNLHLPGVVFKKINDAKAKSTLYFVSRRDDDNPKLAAFKSSFDKHL